MIDLIDVEKTYNTGAGPVFALRGTNLHIDRGEFVAIMGQSGSGKSTMMNILGLLDRPSAGRYLLEGQDVSDLDPDARARIRGREFGFVFQAYNLVSRLSAIEQVEMPLVYQGASDRHARAAKALERVGLPALFHKRGPTQLSGGQQQRVAIARSIVVEPRVMLADEPTGALDTATSAEVMSLFRELVEYHGITVIIVTHERDIAGLCDRIVRMVDGVIVEDASSRHRLPESPSPQRGEAGA